MTIDWLAALERTLDGRVIRRGEPDMVLANKQHAARLPFEPPTLLIRCASAEDVARCVFAFRAAGVRFAVRSGGHCFADISNSAPIVLDLSEIDDVSLNDTRATLGAGLTAGAAVIALAARGLAIPTGGCPAVTMGGLALAGGFGYSGRRFGLLADRVAGLDVVLADGRQTRVDAKTEPELFWALRGGGCTGLAIVTAIEVETAPLLPGVAAFGEWPIECARDLIARWQNWAPEARDAVNIELTLWGPEEPGEPCTVRLHGGAGGTQSGIDGLRDALGSYADDVELVALEPAPFAEHLVGLKTHRGDIAWQPSFPFQRVGFQATRSQFLHRPADTGAIAALIAALGANRRRAEAREVELIPWRGAYARPPAPSCFAHRDAAILVRHTALAGSRSTPEGWKSAGNWASRSHASLQAFGTGCAYQGYAERDHADWGRVAYGAELDRLIAAKRRYDPDFIFASAQSL